jgi:adenylate kinase family enzyme
LKRILVIGSSGAGKSFFSRRLSALTGIEVIHIDRVYWKPGWVEPEKAEFDATLEKLLARDSWIMDGNYGRTLERRLSAADGAILLDLNRVLCTFRVMKRSLLFRNGKRVDAAEGCDERFDWEFLRWTWNYPKRSLGNVLAKLERGSSGKKIFRLRSTADVERFFESLERSGDLDKVEFGLWKR